MKIAARIHRAATFEEKSEKGLAALPAHCEASGQARPAAHASAQRGWLVFLVVWLGSALYLAACLKRGWTPWDAGMLGQTAERVLQGQVPFRDFIDPFAGGLTYLNALAFRLFGTNLFSLRIPLFLFFLVWLPALYALARRFAAPLAAGLVTLLAVAWSLPNYTEAMPSWYNLFFATWGTLALLRYIETEKRRWLWLAGLCGGLSILVKVTGLYFVAAALLFFAFREQSLARPTPAELARHSPGEGGPPRRFGLYRLFIVACLALFLALLLNAVWQRPSLESFVHFVLPGACLAALLLWRESQQSPDVDRARFRALFSMALPLLAGAFIPVAALLVWYAHEGALRDFVEITSLMVMRQVQWATSDPVSLVLGVGLVPATLIFFGACAPRNSTRRTVVRVAPALLGGLLLASWKSSFVYGMVGFSVPFIVPLLAVTALVWLRPRAAASEANTEPVVLVVTVAVLCALIQFPFAQPNYFNYVAPLEILAVLALASLHRRTWEERWALGALAAFYLIFAVWVGTVGFLAANVGRFDRNWKMQALPIARAGGIRLLSRYEQVYARLIPLIQSHARGPYIYAGPECPGVYFLSSSRNPTPTLWEFLDPDFLDVPARTERVLSAIRNHDIHVVVLRDDPLFSGPLPAGLRAALDAQFPQSARVGDFEVRWKP